MTTATLRTQIDALSARLDKACGKSFIAENKKCGKQPSAAPTKEVSPEKSNLTRNLTTAGGIAMVGGVLVGLNLAKDVLNSELPASAKCPATPPKGLYDSFTPGDLIYTSYEMDGILRAHYGVYMGKDGDGNHTILHTTAKEEGGTIKGSHVNKATLDDAASKGSSFRKAGRTKQAGIRPSTEQLHKLAEELNGRNYDWDGFEQNCETFARALVNDLPVSLQGQQISKFNRAITSAIIKGAVGRNWDRTNALTPKEVTERVKKAMNSDSFRADKACGESFIPDNAKCTKAPIQRREAQRGEALRRNLLTGAGIAATGVVLGVLAKGYSEIKESGLPDSAKTPPEPPKGYYDTLTPGDILYRTFPDDVFGVTRAHYAVYAGRDAAGEHTVLHATTKYDADGKEIGSHVKQQTIKDYTQQLIKDGATVTSFRKAQRSDPSRKQTTTEQLHRIIKDLEGKDVTWNGFTENCESFARAVSNDLPTATQSEKVNPVTRQIVRGLLNLMYPGMEGPGKLTNKDIISTVKRARGDAMNPKAQAETILTPLFNGRPLSVLSVSLTPDGTPTGVFRGEPRPGQAHYYTFKMGQNVQFRRIMVNKDSMDEPCGCSDCKKNKRSKGECGCSEKVDALIMRLDKKCGKSGVPDNAQCKKGVQSAAQIHAASMQRAKASGKTHLATMGEKEAIEYTKARIREHYQKVAAKKRTRKRVRGTIARLALSGLVGAAVAGAGVAALNATRKKADGLLERLDKKCGASGIPDNAKCTKNSSGVNWKKVGTVAAVYVAARVGLSLAATHAMQSRFMKEHGVDRAEAKKVINKINELHRKQGPQGAQAYYAAWQRERSGVSTSKSSPVDRDWHKTLGVDEDASAAEIKSAFRKAAKKTHPDQGGNAEDFAKVQKAWESAQALNKVKRGDSIEMEWFVKRLDSRYSVPA